MIPLQRTPRGRHGVLRAALALCGASAALAFLPARARAQQACTRMTAPSTRPWSAPLDKIIPLRARNVSLRDALDRVAAAARFRVSYSAEFLPLDKQVCLSVDSIVAGDALAELLAGVSVEAIVTSADQVVLAPVRSPIKPMSETVQTLERMVVTGSATGHAQRPLTVALDVIDGKKMAARGSSSLASTFDTNVPGLWVWEQTPATLLARYGSIRGASSFNVSYPKIYIDGIEVANPLLVTGLDPAALERVEVIRGPQGAALYGADAISGVVNIITRHEGLQSGADRTQISSGAGASQTDYPAGTVLTQNHALSWRAGSSMRSASLGMNLTTLGAYVPRASSRDLKLNGGARLVTSKASVTGTARLYLKQATVGQNPLLRGFTESVISSPSFAGPGRASASIAPDSTRWAVHDSLPQSVRQYTVGGTATLLTGSRWTPSFTAGVDGYRLANVPNDLAPLSYAIDTALHDARGGADRGTLRAAFVGQYELATRESLTITLAAEHSVLRENLSDVEIAGGPGSHRADVISWRSNSGAVAQGNLSFNEALYVTGGFRLERNDGFTLSRKTVVLPMVGIAGVRDVGMTTFKIRGAYGVGIRPAQTSTRAMALRDVQRYAGGGALDPEEQSGTELGVDILFGRHFAIHVTRFDQTASGLIQPVAIPVDSQPAPGGGGPGGNSGPRAPRLKYVLQNIGEIANHGWELESSMTLGSISLGAALATVDSRVQQIARGYLGDLRTGDRMLGVPAHTATLTASTSRLGWLASMTVSRAFDWINYDRLRLAEDYHGGSYSGQAITGSNLRPYWLSYDGVTRLRATLARDLTRSVSLKLTGDNLTNAQGGEPDNITVLPGRTVLVGLSARIR